METTEQCVKHKIKQNESLSSEAVTGRCSVKKMFLKISQNSQEETCVGVSFLIKLVLYLWKQYTFKLILILLSYHSLSKITKFTLFCMIWRTFRFILKYDCYPLFVWKNKYFRLYITKTNLKLILSHFGKIT